MQRYPMTAFYLIRHATNSWVSTGRLAGWTPGVRLSEEGRGQARALGKRLATSSLAAIYSSPLERTMETASVLAEFHPTLQVQPLDAVGEIRFGQWQGAKLRKLRRERLWSIVQTYPSRARFPGGETIRSAQIRAVDALEELTIRHPNQIVAVVSHSDVIKLVMCHYLGMHIDLFQRIEIAPASLSIVWVGDGRPHIRLMNDTSHLNHVDHPGQRQQRFALGRRWRFWR